MTIRNLDHLLRPTSIALIGGSRRPNTIGSVVARNLFHSRFEGPIMPVHPTERAIEGVLAYPSVEALPVVPDLAVIVGPPKEMPDLIARLGSRGTRAAIILSGGFAELGADGEAIRQKMRDAARPTLLRILGPNSLGVLVPQLGLNASLAHVVPPAGEIAMVAQSTAVLTSIIDWAHARGIGFSHLISFGDQADVDFGDLIDYLASDPQVRSILIYVEALTQARKFMSAARAAARQKPVIAIKAGRFEETEKAASSHAGALAGSDAVYDAAFRRAGVLRVRDLDELFDAVATLSTGLSSATFAQAVSGRLAILANGGGLGVLATDNLIEEGGRLAELAPATVEALNRVLPATWPKANPVDIGSDAPPKRYEDALSLLLEDPNTDAVLVVNSPYAIGGGYWAAQASVEAITRSPGGRRRPVLTSWLGDTTAADARRLFSANRIPTYATPGDAIRGFMYLVEYFRTQNLLMETPDSVAQEFAFDTARVRTLIDTAISEDRAWLTEFEAKQALAAYGIPVVETRRAADPDEAASMAAEIGGPVALKILSPDLTHKSDIGGVALRLGDPERVRAEAIRMVGRVSIAAPDARIEGFTVQQMVFRPDAYELIVGMTEDPLFGPVILFGHGGTGVEVLADNALALPPLNLSLAREMISRTRVYRLLRGFRGQPPAALDDIALTLLKISQMVIDLAEITEIDVNPLLADSRGVIALDARIRVAVPRIRGARRLAIRPYPKLLEEVVQLRDGREYFLRPVRPEDEPQLTALFNRMTQEDIRLRFFAPMKRLPHQLAARLTQIDYDREMALVAQAKSDDGETWGELRGVVRITADPDNERAEYAVMVQSDMKGKGLGSLLMNKIIAYAQSRNIGEIHGQVLRENTGMLRLCRDLGFRRSQDPDDPGVVEVSLRLRD